MLSGVWVLLLLVVLIVGIVSGQPWIIAVTAMTGLVAFGARIWSRLSLEDVSYTRTVGQRYLFPGDETELILTVENRKPLPVPWLRIRDEIPVELEVSGVKVTRTERIDSMRIQDALSLGWYERVRHRVKIRAMKRGHVFFGPGTLESGDLFGLFRSQMRFGSGDPVIVYPHVVPMPELQLPAARPVGDAFTRRRISEDLSRPSGLREYIPGDPIRSIDWKATARLRTPHTRTYDYSVENYLVIMLDASTTMAVWEGYRRDHLERAVAAAASLASRANDLGYRVGLVSNGVPRSGAGHMVLAPGADPRQLRAILEALAMVRPIVMAPLEKVIHSAPEAIPFGSTVMAVSSIFPEHLLVGLDRLASTGHPTVGYYVGDETPPVGTGKFEIKAEPGRFDVPPLESRADLNAV